MRRSSLGVILLAFGAGASSHGGAQTGLPATPPLPAHVYLVAATTPSGNGFSGPYPAALFGIGTDHKLRLVRRLFTVGQGLSEVADDFHGTLYLAGSAGVSVVHESEPAREDFVPLAKPFAFDDGLCWGVVEGHGVPSSAEYCSQNGVTRVAGNRSSGNPRVARGNWSDFRDLQFGGVNGGPFQSKFPIAEIAGTDLDLPSSVDPRVALTKLPPELRAKPELRRRVWIVASTDRYLAVWVVPDSWRNNADAGNPAHAETLEIHILDKPAENWSTLELPACVTDQIGAPVRFFGDWVVTTVMHWSPSDDSSASGPGTENERVTDLDTVPPIRAEYSNRFLHLNIPGELVIQNLRDGRKMTLKTDQEDSEALAIRDDGEMLFRANDSIFSARIEGDHVTAPELLAKGDAAADVHWAFWGP